MTGTRERTALTGALLALAATGWIVSAHRMAGMDMGPKADLGDLGWFAVTWAVMMAAMMLPSLVPAALAVPRAHGFVAGYLAAWSVAGVAAYFAFDAVRSLDHVGAALLLLAAAYQLTPVKAECLRRCRSPKGRGVTAGLRHGTYCVACCAGLMAALFALGVMSLTRMVVVAALIAAERVLPWPAAAVRIAAAALVVLALVSLA